MKQGCPVSPGLFNILTVDLEEVMKKGGWLKGKAERRKMYTLAYTDDKVLLAEEEGMRAI